MNYIILYYWRKKEKMIFTIKEIKDMINDTIHLILFNDLNLFEIDSHERTISQNFAAYLKSKFPEWEIDCEYNRDMEEIKKLEKDGKEVKIYPDIIVHQRVTKQNLLIIEIKKSPPYSFNNLCKINNFFNNRLESNVIKE